MNNKRQFPIALVVILFFIAIVAVFCFTQLEIVPGKRRVGPSREVRDNSFYALEKWLTENDRPVRLLSEGTLDTMLDAPEKTIFVKNSSFRVNADPALLIPWLEEGNQLIISLDQEINYRLKEFMESLGITIAASPNAIFNTDDTEDETDYSFIIEEENSGETDQEKSPFFDWNISFKRKDPETPLKYPAQVINSNGNTKLIKFEIGKGWLIFTGEANFLKNNALREKQNVNLAAEIFLAHSPEDGGGILFLRPISGERHLMGNLAERGNPAALFISIGLLIVAGFWMSIPVFGRFRPAPEKPGKPLHERFLAEGRFLKKNYALGKYIETYEKEVEQRTKNKGILLAENTADTTTAVNPAIKEITFVQFLREQKKLMEQLEKLNRERI